MSRLVTIYGGSGFVGRYVARRMARAGWRVRVAVRRPGEAGFVRPYGAPGQVVPVLCNIRDDASVRAAMNGADAVVNCVGILNGLGKNTFDAVQDEGAGRVAGIATELGVPHLVHVSAIAGGESDYARTKAAGEAAVLAAYPGAVILRPSVIFGADDSFFNRFASMARMMPLIPLPGAATRFQPVYVEDVAQAAVLGATGQAAPGIYELGGPEVMTLREVMERILTVIQRKRVILPLPIGLSVPMAFAADMVQAVTMGLVENTLVTRDQLRSLRHDTVVSDGARGLADLGIQPTGVDTVLPEYLWRFRPAGQYAAIKDSARNMKA
ncbi:NADH dehydrogenase [Gemmobacter megaterium]|uniref:NADH dehydrogenase n=1 Tax=Gemmobacter megaterium TaxID=1086013 RepID=A0A1N7KUM6_9RHOB|nr:complex I NDUFA9 subunit family protein [Gemmobacter megaterium]GGE03893.1 3-beta-hydroxy-Delta(5)-steroid dehydrogenase [Gemmobacter megaterium]SIS65247.1 NADH dehydrogenase [Gemmobacter megaterium]